VNESKKTNPMMKHLLGLDHVMVLVRDLDAAAQTWRRLGFTVSPRGIHSAHMGSGNHTLMLGPDYIELLGVLAETPHNAVSRARLAKHEGLERAAFTTDDAAAGAARLRERALAAVGPLDFGRPVELPGGRTTEARFRVFQWPPEEAPAGMRIFACQHVTPEAVWIPELQAHANTAKRIKTVEIVAKAPKASAQHLAGLIEGTANEQDDCWSVPSGTGRATFDLLDRQAMARRHPGVTLDGLPVEGPVGLVLEVADLAAAASCAGSTALRAAGSVTVPPQSATGVILTMV